MKLAGRHEKVFNSSRFSNANCDAGKKFQRSFIVNFQRKMLNETFANKSCKTLTAYKQVCCFKLLMEYHGILGETFEDSLMMQIEKFSCDPVHVSSSRSFIVAHLRGFLLEVP